MSGLLTYLTINLSGLRGVLLLLLLYTKRDEGQRFLVILFDFLSSVYESLYLTLHVTAAVCDQHREEYLSQVQHFDLTPSLYLSSPHLAHLIFPLNTLTRAPKSPPFKNT